MTIIKLTYPVKDGDKTINELELRRPNVRDHIKLDHKSAALQREGKKLEATEKDALMYAALADVDIDIIYQLDMSDWGKCREFYLGCMMPSKDSAQKTETD